MSKVVSKGRVSEEAVKTALEKFNGKKLVAHLASVELNSDEIDKLIKIMRQGGLPLIKHSNASSEARRRQCLEQLATYVKGRAGDAEAAKIDDFLRFIERIEWGYRTIMASSDAAAPPIDTNRRISSILSATVRDYLGHHSELMDLYRRTFNEKNFVDPHAAAFSVEGLDGSVDPDVLVDVGVNLATMSLLLEGYRKQLFNGDGILVIDPPVSVGDADMDAIGPVLQYAGSWRFWEHMEECARYFGGSIETVDLAEFPQLTANGVEELWWHGAVGLDWRRIDFAANQRLVDQLGQNYTEIEYSAAAKMAKGLENIAGLPPREFITTTEIHTLWALGEALSFEPSDDPGRYHGLRLVEWIRGYCLLHALATDRARVDDQMAGDLMPIVTRKELLQLLRGSGMDRSAALRFIELAQLSKSSRDLFDTPLVAIGEDRLLLFGPAILTVIPAQAILSRLSSLSTSFDARGTAFEQYILDLFHRQGLTAVSFEEKIDGEQYDYDVMLRWDPYVFLFECKSRSLSANNDVRSFRCWQDVGTNIKQVKRLVGGLERRPDLFDKHLGSGASELTIVPCVLHSLPFAAGEIDGINFCDASGVSRLFASPTFNSVVQAKDGKALSLPTYRLWEGADVSSDDLYRQVTNPPQLRMSYAEHHARRCQSMLAPGVIAMTDRIVRQPLSHPERIAVLLQPDTDEGSEG